MRFDGFSAAAKAVWAKSGDPAGHGLLAHMLDVASVAERLLLREPPGSLLRASAAFGLPEVSASRIIAACGGLYDIGKAIAGFQTKWPQGQAADEAAGLQFPAHLLAADQHDLASAYELRRLLQPHFGDLAPALAGAVAAHHGHFFDSHQVAAARRPGEPPAWAEVRAEIFANYIATLMPHRTEAPRCAGAEAPGLPVLAWLAGLTSVADWIGSNTDWFSPGERAASLMEHHARSLQLADDALDAIGWPPHQSLLPGAANTDELIARIVGQAVLAARPLQTAADALLQFADSPVLLIVEAPMDEGKTELALLATTTAYVATEKRRRMKAV